MFDQATRRGRCSGDVFTVVDGRDLGRGARLVVDLLVAGQFVERFCESLFGGLRLRPGRGLAISSMANVHPHVDQFDAHLFECFLGFCQLGAQGVDLGGLHVDDVVALAEFGARAHRCLLGSDPSALGGLQLGARRRDLR